MDCILSLEYVTDASIPGTKATQCAMVLMFSYSYDHVQIHACTLSNNYDKNAPEILAIWTMLAIRLHTLKLFARWGRTLRRIW